MEEFANSYTGQTQDGTQADGDQYNTPEENELTSSQEDSYEGTDGNDSNEDYDSNDGADDYREKFAASTRENQLQSARIKELEAKLERMGASVSDDELAESVPDWEKISDREKEVLRRAIKSEKTVESMSKMMVELLDKNDRKDALNTIYEQNPEIAKRKQDFERYINKKSRKGAPMDVLKDSFLYSLGAEVPRPKKVIENPVPGLAKGRGSMADKRFPDRTKSPQLSKEAMYLGKRLGLSEDILRTGKPKRN